LTTQLFPVSLFCQHCHIFFFKYAGCWCPRGLREGQSSSLPNLPPLKSEMHGARNFHALGARLVTTYASLPRPYLWFSFLNNPGLVPRNCFANPSLPSPVVLAAPTRPPNPWISWPARPIRMQPVKFFYRAANVIVTFFGLKDGKFLSDQSFSLSKSMWLWSKSFLFHLCFSWCFLLNKKQYISQNTAWKALQFA
jgi:hypothetical protein